MNWQIILALTLAIAVILFPAVYVGYLTVGGLNAAAKRSEKGMAQRLKGTLRGIITAGKIAIPTAAYGALIWFFLSTFGWPVALGVGLAIPVLAVPVALVWYLQVSGVLQVIRDRMQRRRMRAEAVKEAEEILSVTGKEAPAEMEKEEVMIRLSKKKS